MYPDMRLVKKQNNDEVFQITHREWFEDVFVSVEKKLPYAYVQICEPPKMGKLKPIATRYYNLTKIEWTSHRLLRMISSQSERNVKGMVKAIHEVKNDANKDYALKNRRHLVDYILELAYDLGWTEEHKEEEEKNENSKSNKQAVRKKAGKRKRAVGRPKKKLVKSN